MPLFGRGKERNIHERVEEATRQESEQTFYLNWIVDDNVVSITLPYGRKVTNIMDDCFAPALRHLSGDYGIKSIAIINYEPSVTFLSRMLVVVEV